MSKKYVPSGYQIINLDLSDKTSGTPFTPETEDEKLLHEILSSIKLSKPILIHIITNAVDMCGFALLNDGSLYIGDNNYSELISYSGEELIWSETEL